MYPEGIRKRNSRKLYDGYLNKTNREQGKIPGLIKYYLSQHPLSGRPDVGHSHP